MARMKGLGGPGSEFVAQLAHGRVHSEQNEGSLPDDLIWHPIDGFAGFSDVIVQGEDGSWAIAYYGPGLESEEDACQIDENERWRHSNAVEFGLSISFVPVRYAEVSADLALALIED